MMVKKSALLGILLIVAVFSLAGCGKNKTPLTAEEFKTKMEDNSYTVQDATDQFDGQVETCSIAIKGDFEYQIEFFEVSTEEQAVSSYNENKQDFEVVKSADSTETTVEVANYGKYTLSTNGNYYVISRIGTSFIYVKADDTYKDEIEDILSTLGY